mmetsp:Transcript_75596/g.200799  ORF Transcript_75596/g.200799 Transcript_75596/m.200799 type:complete len:433 (-) Transcript_75596:43-1341(-)|eukprot:CAMPEP_0171212876 /NCGR_PEP_ID=MMETSP0790-20130122/30358_1 /TAXON_ID=2925 /ORGANISM="Alexandrium catenella, Strain OF101" /LENGTH=432 /DNA_ID=CAMNT_0011678573 /DNA_START=55 /DNA_END=1353 /DNA_ORIENTATION=-
MSGTASASQFVNRSAQEHLLYIQEKVNPILEALVTAVLLERPEDPSFFMLKWLCEQTKSLDAADQGGQRGGSSTAEEIETVRKEIQKLKDRKAELLAMRAVGKVDTRSEKSTKADEDEEDEDEDDDDDMADIMPEPPKNRQQRQSVSAEAYGAWNKKTEFVAPVYEKTPDQKARIERCLGPSFLFQALEKKEMDTVVLAFKEKQVEPDVRVIQQGDDGESMFLIEEGKVDCIKKIDGEDKVVKTCSAGDVFGELALLYNCPRAASVESKERTTLWELDRETFNRIVKEAAAGKRTTYTEFLKKVPLFGNIDQYEMMTIADALKVETYDKEDTLIIKQGDAGDKFFVTLEGECVAKKAFIPGQEPQKVMTHKVGDYFGELSLLKNEPRAASVYTSAANTKLLSMDRKTFKRLMGPIEDILRREATRYDVVSSN